MIRFPAWWQCLRCPKPQPTNDQLEQFMATLADVNTELTGLKSDFDTLVTQATALYHTVKNTPPPAATAADLDAIVATVKADRVSVQTALATVSAQ